MRRPTSVAVLLLIASLLPALPAAAAAKKRPARRVPTLKAFKSCSSLVAYARRYAVKPAVAGGVPVRALPPGQAPLGVEQRSATGVAAPAPSAPALSDSSAGAFSGTNIQEQGVDEPDIVKTDGRRVFVLAGQRLLAYDVAEDTPRLLGSLTVGGAPSELLLRGDRVLVIGSDPGSPLPLRVAPGGPRALSLPYRVSSVLLTEVNVKDPAAMTVSRTLTVEGAYVSARLTGGTARVVLNTSPALPVETTVPGGPAVAVTAAKTKLGLRAFVPQTTIRSNISRRTFRRPLVGCSAVRRPDVYSGLELLSVMTIDLDRGLYSVDRDAVMAGAQAVYASTGSLYVASQRYVAGLEAPADVPPRMTTEIHRFDTSDDRRTTFRSSGSLPGFVLNQFALSEDRGVLRVATTEDPLWMNGAQQQDSQSGVSVLRERGRRLVTIGRIGGLGKGERIYGVRFLGAAGYLVTFRQVDPLYTLDLSDPAAPKLAGELKVAGYSAYLHPVGDGLLLGVGQDATEQGRRLGPQVSLFDVSDLTAPKRLAQHPLGDQGAGTEAEWDHHAFLWWAPLNLAVLPLQQSGGVTQVPPAPGPPVSAAATAAFSGAVGLRVQRAGITEAGRVSHDGDPYPAVVRRSLVAQGRLLTISDRGIAAGRLSDLGLLGFTSFPAP